MELVKVMSFLFSYILYACLDFVLVKCSVTNCNCRCLDRPTHLTEWLHRGLILCIMVNVCENQTFYPRVCKTNIF